MTAGVLRGPSSQKSVALMVLGAGEVSGHHGHIVHIVLDYDIH